jgi:nucleoid DNA-binding protein
MENKISFPQFVAILAIATGKQKKQCEDFLKELFRIIADELEKGESVRIKGFGTFKLVEVEARRSVDVTTGESNEIPGHYKVSFIPSKELAALVNSPFEAFEAVEVADDLTMDELVEPEPEDEPASEVVPASEETGASEEVPASEETSCEEVPEVEKAEVPAEAVAATEDDQIYSLPDEKDEIQEEQPIEPEVNVTGAEEDDRDAYRDDDRGCAMKSHKFGWGFFAGFMTAIVVAAAALLVWLTFFINREEGGVAEIITVEEIDSPVEEGEVSNADSTFADTSAVDTQEVPTRPSDEKVYDTISTTRFLTTMAKEHYGNFNLWPIIYEENQAILGHPDRIKPGTQVVVPPLSKYGIDPKNPADVKRVKEKGLEIYGRYR